MTVVFAQQINVNDDKVGVVAWHVEDGDFIDVGDDLVDLETSKAVVTVSAEVAGQVHRLVKKGAIVQVGAPICHIGEGASDTPIVSAPVAVAPIAVAPALLSVIAGGVVTLLPSRPQPSPPPVAGRFAIGRLSRRARDTIATMGLSEADFAGTGLVTARSILAKQTPSPAPATVQAFPARAAMSLVAPPGAPRSEPVSLGKRAEIDMLSTGESGLINSTISVYFDAGPLRDRLQREGKFDGAVQPILLYELSRLLKKWPQFTAYFDAGEIHYYDRIDLGVAIDLGRGLKS